MTTDLKKQFFDTFGIEAKCETRAEHRKHECYGMVDCDECASAIYPQITDSILLELICILSKYQKDRGSLLEIDEISLNEIKEEILEMLIYRVDGCKHQVQALFKEGR